MIRLICRTNDACAVAHGAAQQPEVTFKTIDVDLPDVEAFLRNVSSAYETREVIGVELIEQIDTARTALKHKDAKS